MAHLRNRLVLNLIKKKLSFAPILAIQGVRQRGKSVLIRNLLPKVVSDISYDTLDNPDTLDFAQNATLTFLARASEVKHFAIDEAQKSPKIFDAIKYLVDLKRTPGKFILLGSTEFSLLFKIRESLTGRMSRVRLYPMTAAEELGLVSKSNSNPFFLLAKPILSRIQLVRHLERGGMPGIFSIREASQREEFFRDWLELTCQRDLTNIPKGKFDPALAFRILELIAQVDLPDAASIASKLRKDGRVIRSHLEALKSLFVIHELPPHPLGTGKTIYFLCDVGIAHHLKASFERKLWTWVIQENLAKRSYFEPREGHLYYYRNSKGSILHLVEETTQKISALKILPEEKVSELDLLLLRAFKNKAPQAELYALGSQEQKRESVRIFSWEAAG